jgi:hypothetical protein
MWKFANVKDNNSFYDYAEKILREYYLIVPDSFSGSEEHFYDRLGSFISVNAYTLVHFYDEDESVENVAQIAIDNNWEF